MDNNKFFCMLKNIMDKYNVTICENDVKKLLGISHFRVVCKGEILIGIDEPLKYTGLILDGITRSYYLDTDGNDVTKGFGIVGGLCMDEGLFGYNKSICACETIEDTTVMLMETKMLKELCMENNELKNVYIYQLEQALRYKIYRESSFLTSNATERYLTFREKYPQLCERAKQSYIATYLGIAPESLSRIRKAIR